MSTKYDLYCVQYYIRLKYGCHLYRKQGDSSVSQIAHVIHSNTQNNILGCQVGGQAKRVVWPSKTGAQFYSKSIGRCLIADMTNEFTFDQATASDRLCI